MTYYERNKKDILEKRKQNYLSKKNDPEYKEKRKNYQKTYKKLNKDKLTEYNKLWKDNNSNYWEKYYSDNKEKIVKNSVEYQKLKRKNNPLYKLSIKIKNQVKQSLKRKKYTSQVKVNQILGCSFEDFKRHLESKFEDWMSWDNYGLYNGELNYGWDIDHIVPLSSVKTKDELLQLFHHTNLQPLFSKVNRNIKRNKLL